MSAEKEEEERLGMIKRERERDGGGILYHALNTTFITNTENSFPVSSWISVALPITHDHARGTQPLWPKLHKVRLMTL